MQTISYLYWTPQKPHQHYGNEVFFFFLCVCVYNFIFGNPLFKGAFNYVLRATIWIFFFFFLTTQGQFGIWSTAANVHRLLLSWLWWKETHCLQFWPENSHRVKSTVRFKGAGGRQNKFPATHTHTHTKKILPIEAQDASWHSFIKDGEIFFFAVARRSSSQRTNKKSFSSLCLSCLLPWLVFFLFVSFHCVVCVGCWFSLNHQHEVFFFFFPTGVCPPPSMRSIWLCDRGTRNDIH